MRRERRNLFRSSLIIEPLWRRAALAALALLVYALAFVPLYARAGVGVSALSIFPVVVLGWLFGAWGGLLGGVLSVPLNALLLAAVGEPGWALVVESAGAEASALVLVVGAVVGLLRDLGLRLDRHLTEWRRAERALRDSEDRYRLLFERSRDPMFLSRPDGGIIEANDALLRLFGAQRSDLLEAEITDFFEDEDDRDRYWGEIARVGFVEDLPVRLRIEGGAPQDCLVTASARYGPDRSVLEYQGSIRNVSESHTLHSLAERRTRELETAIHELEAFTYSVSHDLRTHLVTMGGFASILWSEHREALPPEAQAHLERVLRASRRMDAFVQDLLRYSRVTRAEVAPERVPLGEVMESATTSLAPLLAERGAEVEVRGQLPVVQADRHLLGRAVENLLSNAVKFVPEDRTPRVSVRATTAGHRVRLEIEDNGVGIAEEDRTRIFEAFERLQPGAFQGTGVGLTIVKRALDRLGGDVGLSSRPGEGSTFWIVLPEALPPELEEIDEG